MMRANILKIALIFLIFIPAAFISCKKENDEVLPVDPIPINLSKDQISLIDSENSFAFGIFNKIVEDAEENKNIILSPLSISCALSMTLNGANGTTRDAILETLRLNGISADVINNSYKNLTEDLLSVDKRVLISIANSVWIENNFVVKNPFTDILTGFYNAESHTFDIYDPLAPTQINRWIESKTNGLIKNMVEKLDDNTVMLLINAIYFKGKWNSQFDAKNTVQMSFNKSGGTKTEVPMMKQTSDYKSYSGDGFILAEFPYGQGNFVMDIIFPDEENGTNTLLPFINENNFNGWLNQMRERKTDLIFPRFKYGYKKQLKNILSGMGMEMAFKDNADFSNISDQALLISDVTHQAFIETNEEGTEAAAVTIVSFGTISAPEPPFTIKIDHPFIYIIRETTTNAIIFMGRVADPSVS
jgi:serine protease inhibitor